MSAMMMRADMVYAYPTWMLAFALVGIAVAGAVAVELTARRVIGAATRQRHNDVAAAMFSVIGVTFAVLLAFVVMLTFEGYANARMAAGTEAMTLRDVANLTAGLAEPARAGVRRVLAAYTGDVIRSEWPAQALGHFDDSGSVPLQALNAAAAAYRPSTPVDVTYHAAFLGALTRLQDARALRQLAASNTVPGIVWTVMLLGGSLTVMSGSFLGAPSLRMHLMMSATLAASGALVVVLIVALSQPFRGDFRVSTVLYERVLADIAASTRSSDPAVPAVTK